MRQLVEIAFELLIKINKISRYRPSVHGSSLDKGHITLLAQGREDLTTMSISQDTTTGSISIACGEYLDISNIGQISKKLRDALDSSDPTIFLDGEAVERADAAGLQLLAAFFKDAKSQGITLHWRKPSDALKTASRITGLSSLLDLNAG